MEPLAGNEGLNLDGSVKGYTAPFDITKTDITKYYYNEMRAASMHNKDGKKLAFIFNICATDILEDQKYLDKEIELRNPHLRMATAIEIEAFKMRTDPRGTIRGQLRDEVTAEITAKLTAELEAALVDKDGKKLEGVDAIKAKLDAMKKGGGAATVVKGATGVAITLNPGEAPLKGIVSTADLSGATADSTQK